MTADERIHRIRDAMRDCGWDIIVCALPANVLALSGYWPIIGTGVACVTREGRVQLLVPEDEHELAARGWVKDVATFGAGSLDSLAPTSKAIKEPLRKMIGSACSRIAYEAGEVSEPASYAAMHLYQGAMPELLKELFPRAVLAPADDLFSRVRAIKTGEEIERIRGACRTAAQAYSCGARQMSAGTVERQAAEHFRSKLICTQAERAGGLVSCMSGANSGRAYGAFARSTHKQIAPGDLVLTHCNSFEDGYWTDITRTFVSGRPDNRQEAMYEAVHEARRAALAQISDGAAARDVDRAARETLAERGFGDQFKHATGHGVGFGAIDAHAVPRLHPKSPDRLEIGMVFNVEPGIYFPEFGGIRHCDVIALSENVTELLTPFQSKIEEAVV